MAELIVNTPEGTVQRYRLGPVTILGRHPDCDIVLTDPMSSRRHAKIELGPNGQYFVEDNHSANGTALNNDFLRTRLPYRDGDTLQIGSTLLTLRLNPMQVPRTLPGPQHLSDASLSIVRVREDVSEAAPSIDYSMAAGKGAVTAEEESSSDLIQLKRVTQRLKLLLDIGQALASSLEPRKVLMTCLDKLFEVFPQAERGFILLYGPDGEIPQSIAAEGLESDALTTRQGPVSVQKVRNPVPGQEHEVAVSRTIVNRVRELRQSILVSDATSDAAYNPAMSMARLEIHSVMCSPLIASDDDLGILYLDTKDAARRFGPDDVNLINAVTGQLAIVIKNAELARQAASEAASRQNLQRFLSPHLVDRIIKKELTVELGGSLKHGTVFFSDIVGFTRMAAQMRPGDVVALLNRYFRVMQEIIFARGGTVDKTGGDAIMAFWGVLVSAEFATANSVTAAIEMQNAMFVFNRELALDENIVKPPEPLGHGIGLNTGDFIAGNIGSERKIEFTVIGNAVNLAQRVESIAGRGQVFVGAGTYEEIRDRAIVFRLPDCPVKNVAKPIPIYSLRGIIPPSATGSGTTAGTPHNVTSRVEPGSQSILFTLPCKLVQDGRKPVNAVVVRMVCNRSERRARLQVQAETPIPPGSKLRLLWDLQEKPKLSPLNVEVERSWTPKAPGSVPPPEQDVGDGSTSLIEIQSEEGSLLLVASDVADDVMELRPGVEIPSDLRSYEEIIRA
ncbi:MAG: FHA domain-containing protein [Planctomycetes bacterium]|nr:FHA domain-containing protein [Planctomycetota bacterium]